MRKIIVLLRDNDEVILDYPKNKSFIDINNWLFSIYGNNYFGWLFVR